MAEWTIATVCKTVTRKGSEGSNPSPSTSRRRGSVAEHLLGKEKVMGPIPIVGSELLLLNYIFNSIKDLREEFKEFFFPSVFFAEDGFFG